MINKFFLKLTLLLTCFCLSAKANNIGYESPQIIAKELQEAEFYFLIDPDNNDILLSKNSDVKVAPSSMTKLMTSYVVFDQIQKGFLTLDQQCLVSKNAYRKIGSTMFLNYGDHVTIDELLTGLLVVSGNDSAVALAEATAGNVKSFAKLMNAKAQQIGLENSHFQNPHGLSQEGHYMTMRDLATLIGRIYLDFPEYAKKYMSMEEYTYSNITQKNRNPLIQHHYQGIIGGKTGHTDAGGYGVVDVVKRGDRKLIAVMNKGDSSKQRAKIITQLFDYGFDNFNKYTLFEKGQVVGKVKTWLGQEDFVDVIIDEKIEFNIPVQYDLDSINVEVKYQGPINSPINKGKKVAKLLININDNKKLEYDLFAKNDVKEAGFFKKIGQIISHKFTNLK